MDKSFIFNKNHFIIQKFTESATNIDKNTNEATAAAAAKYPLPAKERAEKKQSAKT
jgi:hypothetical protein